MTKQTESTRGELAFPNTQPSPEDPAQMHPICKARARQDRKAIVQVSESDAYAFFKLLTGPELFEIVEWMLPPHRERQYPPTETIAMFLAQALNADRSVKRLVLGLSPGSTHTGAYCRARKRLPLVRVGTLARHVGKRVSARAPTAWRWPGRPVRLVDGATVTMPDTVANQTSYPQPRSQKPGLGFPQCRIVGRIEGELSLVEVSCCCWQHSAK